MVPPNVAHLRLPPYSLDSVRHTISGPPTVTDAAKARANTLIEGIVTGDGERVGAAYVDGSTVIAEWGSGAAGQNKGRMSVLERD